MTQQDQSELPLFRVAENDSNVEWLVRELAGRDWILARDVLALADKPDTEGNRRWVRALATASRGRVAGGQRGYKLISEMTREEFLHYRNWMKSQADEMTSRIIKSDRVWYQRPAVSSGNGVLDPDLDPQPEYVI